MENLNTQIDHIVKKHSAALATEVAAAQKAHLMLAFGLNESSNGASNGASHEPVAAAPVAAKSTKVSAKKPVAKKVGKTAKAAAKTDDAKAAANKAKGVKRDPELLEKLKGSILTYVSTHCQKEDDKGNKGITIEVLKKALKADSKDLTLPMKKLIADKKITTTGQKRATRYWAK